MLRDLCRNKDAFYSNAAIAVMQWPNERVHQQPFESHSDDNIK